MAKKPLHGVIISDTHCGHLVGLTPPAWDSDTPRGAEYKHSFWEMRRAIWNWVEETVHALPTLDWVLYNGDAIDGKGRRSGSTEQLVNDRQQQVDIADAAYRQLFYNRANRPKLFMSYGTPYHTGKSEDWENTLANQLNAEHIAGEHAFDVRGLVVNHKHHISSSQVPHGRSTALGRDVLWNKLWALRGEYPAADVIVRSHVHYHRYTGEVDWLALTTPALQGYGSKFGTRVPSGTVDVGIVYFEVYDRENWTWRPFIWRAPFKAAVEVG